MQPSNWKFTCGFSGFRTCRLPRCFRSFSWFARWRFRSSILVLLPAQPSRLRRARRDRIFASQRRCGKRSLLPLSSFCLLPSFYCLSPPCRSAPSSASKRTVVNAAKFNMGSPRITIPNSLSTGAARSFTFHPSRRLPTRLDMPRGRSCFPFCWVSRLRWRLPNQPASNGSWIRSSCCHWAHQRSCSDWALSFPLGSG